MFEEIFEMVNRWRKSISKAKLLLVLNTIKGRYKKHNNIIWISRKETEKFGISESLIKRIINCLLMCWFFTKVGKARNKENKLCNIYSITKNFISDFLESIRDFWKDNIKTSNISEKIISWCNDTDIIDFIDVYWPTFWLEFIKRNTLDKGVKTNWNIITDFKTWEVYNLFDYIKLITSIDTYKLALQLKIIG